MSINGPDLIVLGGGPAGITAALQARELGATVTLLEKSRIGGTTLNSGPAPVRTLARAARLMRDWSSWEAFGLRGPRPTLDLHATMANAERVSRHAYERRHLAEQIRDLGVDLVEETGDARFLDATTIAGNGGRTWSAERFILAVGGRASRLPIPGAELGMTYEDLRSIPALPGRVCVIGAADTGCQLASILGDFGCKVSLLEYAPRIVPRGDEDISRELEAAFRAREIEVVTGAKVEQLQQLGPAIRVSYRIGDIQGATDVDAVFFAVGWPSNADRLNAAAAGVALERGYVVVDDYLRTTAPQIFAAGDIDGHSMLVSSALLEGRIAAENALLGPQRPVLHDIVPAGSFTDPEYASVGLTEAQARSRYDCNVAVAHYEDLLRPVADGQPEGFCKLIVESEGRQIVGAHVLGEYSAEVIQVAAACMAAHMPIEDVADLQLAFPTFTEGIGMAARKLVRELGVRTMHPAWSSLTTDSFSKAA
jgi:dihydrolipoamide dehydrogenase